MVGGVSKRCLCQAVYQRGTNANQCPFAPVGRPCSTFVPACLILTYVNVVSSIKDILLKE